jgi:predicted nucleic acid-binding protein
VGRQDGGSAAAAAARWWRPLGLAFADLLALLLTLTASHLMAGLPLFRDHDRLGAFDAVLAAAALDVGALALVSADRAFGSVPDLIHQVPDAESVQLLIQG